MIMKKQHTQLYGVIGLGRFGYALAETLARAGKEVMVVDANPDKVKAATAYTDNAFVSENLTREALHVVGLQNCDTVIVCIGEKVDVSILTTLNVISMGIPHVIAKAISSEQGAVLEKLGAEVVYPERDSALRLADKLVTNQVLEYIQLSDEVDITELMLTARIHGLTVMEADLRGKYGINLIAVKHGESTITDITPALPLHAGDVVALVGKRVNIARFSKWLES